MGRSEIDRPAPVLAVGAQPLRCALERVREREELLDGERGVWETRPPRVLVNERQVAVARQGKHVASMLPDQRPDEIDGGMAGADDGGGRPRRHGAEGTLTPRIRHEPWVAPSHSANGAGTDGRSLPVASTSASACSASTVESASRRPGSPGASRSARPLA